MVPIIKLPLNCFRVSEHLLMYSLHVLMDWMIYIFSKLSETGVPGGPRYAVLNNHSKLEMGVLDRRFLKEL